MESSNRREHIKRSLPTNTKVSAQHSVPQPDVQPTELLCNLKAYGSCKRSCICHDAAFWDWSRSLLGWRWVVCVVPAGCGTSYSLEQRLNLKPSNIPMPVRNGYQDWTNSHWPSCNFVTAAVLIKQPTAHAACLFVASDMVSCARLCTRSHRICSELQWVGCCDPELLSLVGSTCLQRPCTAAC